MSTGDTGLLLVEPVAFGFNAETASTNSFQNHSGLPAASIAVAAREEFRSFVTTLRSAGLPLAVAIDSIEPAKPDAVFPNNWVSFHADGTVVLYPMHDPNRRAERREAVIDAAKEQLGFRETRRIDLSGEESHGRFLEGTGSLVLDHRNRVAYACRSPRTSDELVREWARLMNYEPCLFDAATPDGKPVYHTNVVLWLGEAVAGVGLDWVSPAQRAALVDKLRGNGHELLKLTDRQLRHFAGNMLEVVMNGRRRLIASSAASGSLHQDQLRQLAAAGCELVTASIPVIERHGGGSVRCMLAQVPLQGGTR